MHEFRDDQMLQITEDGDGDTHVVTVRGELDISTAAVIEPRLHTLLESSKQVVLDLSELSFIDSSGIAVLIAAANAADGNGGSFSIRAASDRVRRVLDLAGVAEKLRVSPVPEHDGNPVPEHDGK